MSQLAADQLRKWRLDPSLFVREVFGAIPDPWQDEVLRSFPTSPRIAMKASKGPGKGFAKSLKVFTPSGWMRWGDLGIGDHLFAPDGSHTKITGTFDLGVEALWRVTFDDGSSACVTGDHLWAVRGAAERVRKHAVPYQRQTKTAEIWSVLSTKEIIARGVRVKNGRWRGRQFEIPLHDAVQLPPKQLPIDPYVLGVWLGDGHRGEPSYDKPYTEIRDEITKRGIATSVNGSRVRILGAMGAFRSLPCFQKCSPDRFIPKDYLEGSISQRFDVICGLMDTDGCIGAESSMEYDSTSKQLAEDVVWLARSLGWAAFYKPTIKRGWYTGTDGERVECRDCYRVTIRSRQNPFRIKHKADRWRDPMRSASTSRYLKRYIDKIEPCGEADSMCVEVDHPTACHLANDFIVTHNTAVLAWLGWNFMLTRPYANCAAISISSDNLRDNLWKELAVWRNKSPLLQAAFEWRKERIFAKDHPESWFMSARSWSQSADATQLGNTLAGLHAKYTMALIDESGGMPPAIVESAEGIFSGAIEAHIVQAGNTNSLDGALYTACVKNRSQWKVVVISGDPDDPNRSTRVPLEWAMGLIKSYGRDNPFVKVSVLGEWPTASINALLGPDEVEAAFNRKYQEDDIKNSPRILGVDVAREGDDASVIFPRQGLVAFKPHIMRNVDGIQGAGQVARVWQDWNVDAVFIDNTGGFGSSWIDNLRLLNRSAIPVGFAERRDTRYHNRRAEMYFEMANWVKAGGSLPNVPDLVAELTQTTYSFRGDALLLEPKESIKAKIGRSPDLADALCLTWAQPVASKAVQALIPRSRNDENYDPFRPYLG